MVAVMAGCGGDDESSSLSKAEFTKEADAICARQEEKKNKDLIAAYKKYGEEGRKGKKAQADFILEAALPPIAQMTEELADLGAPSGEEDKVEAMVQALEEEIQNIEDDPIGTATGKVGDFDKANKLAKELNLKACSQI